MSDHNKDFKRWHEVKGVIDASKKYPICNPREIWWCSVGLNVGAEQDGKNALYERPVLVLRRFSKELFLGAPLTTKLKSEPFRANVFFKKYRSKAVEEQQVLLSHIRSYDTSRLDRKMARLGSGQFDDILDSIEKMVRG